MGTLRFGASYNSATDYLGADHFGADYFGARPFRREKVIFSIAFKKPHAPRGAPFNYYYIPLEMC